MLLCINDVHLMPRIKEAKLSAERLGNLTWIGRDVRCLWCDCNEHLHQEVARRHVSGIKGAHKANVVFWIGSVKAELFMKFTDRCLLRRFVPFELATWEGDLSAVAATLCALDQQHLAVKRVRVNALATTRWAAAPECHRGH